MTEQQKDRIHCDDADVDLQFLEDELANFKVREKKRMEEERKRLEAVRDNSMLDSSATDTSM